ncbi:MAG: MoaD/ThiS family protein [Actinobacteria bacterium]|nr:MoaD/ThiS family protein [Actinomycetota bacterium]MBU1943430.1 MoaD/ThiS family protein [Actinomycetota bacterium]MBU2686787.1 MoaD/ThiS family protein [Actinomycetota bacterium]
MPKVKFYATLIKAAGGREASVEASNVGELINRLRDGYGGRLDRYLKVSTVLVNGTNVTQLKGRKTRLKPDDVVSIFPPLGGG